MPCTPSYCDIHDYPVASPWCNYAWNNTARRDPPGLTLEQVQRKIDKSADEIYEELRHELSETPRFNRPEPATSAKRTFRGVDV